MIHITILSSGRRRRLAIMCLNNSGPIGALNFCAGAVTSSMRDDPKLRRGGRQSLDDQRQRKYSKECLACGQTRAKRAGRRQGITFYASNIAGA